MTIKKNVKTRFAPSPTGFLHLGGIRTALYNYLYAKHNKGQFIIRIEDTDLKRNLPLAVNDIEQYLSWLELKIDNLKKNKILKTYYQSARAGFTRSYLYKGDNKNLYFQKAVFLIKQNLAYYCFCKNKNKNECNCQQKKIKQYKKKSFVIKLKIKKNLTFEWEDLIRGKITFHTNNVRNFVIIKKNKLPTYNFANVIDDIKDKITTVFRGEEHISNTFKQIILYDYLKHKNPQFGHLNVMFNSLTSKEGYKKLSKRDKSKTDPFLQLYNYFKKNKFPVLENSLKKVIINFTVFLGWFVETKNEKVYNLSELSNFFNGKNISKHPVVCDTKKFFSILYQEINENWENLKKEISDFLKKQFSKQFKSIDKENFKDFLEIWKTNILEWIKQSFAKKEKFDFLLRRIKQITNNILFVEKEINNSLIEKIIEEELKIIINKNNFNYKENQRIENKVNSKKIIDELKIEYWKKYKNFLLIKDKTYFLQETKTFLDNLINNIFQYKIPQISFFLIRIYLTNFYYFSNNKIWEKKKMPPVKELINFIPKEIIENRTKNLIEKIGNIILNLKNKFKKEKKCLEVETLKKRIIKKINFCILNIVNLNEFYINKGTIKILLPKKTKVKNDILFFSTEIKNTKNTIITKQLCLDEIKKQKINDWIIYQNKFINYLKQQIIKKIILTKKNLQKTRNLIKITEEIINEYKQIKNKNKLILILNERIYKKLFLNEKIKKNLKLKNLIENIKYLFLQIIKIKESKTNFIIYDPKTVIFSICLGFILNKKHFYFVNRNWITLIK